MAKLLHLFILALFVHSCVSTSCSFNAKCQCENAGGNLKATCIGFNVFPTFLSSTVNLKTLEISGTYSTIPINAFANLNGNVEYLAFIRTGNLSIPISIDDNAFAGTTQNFFQTIYFDNFKALNAIPTTALAQANGLSEFYVQQCNIATLQNNSFDGLKVSQLILIGNQMVNIESNAFNGLGNYLNNLKINEQLTQFPMQQLQSLAQLSVLDLSSNKISTLPPNSVASLTNLKSLTLNSNPISNAGLSNTSFANAQRLSSVNIETCLLTAIPLGPLSPLSTTLTSVSFKGNQITTIQPYTFRMFSNLQTATIDANPITVLPPYAFFGLQTQSFIPESLNSMLTVSMDVFSGMPNVETVGFHHCDYLINITATDASKLPATLNSAMITMNVDLQAVDPSIQDWLALSETNVFNLKGTSSFDCNPSIVWMYPWVFCKATPQIFDVAESVFCAVTKVEFKTYLSGLQNGC